MLINIVALEMLGAKMPKPTGEEDDDVNGDDGEEDDDDKIIKMLTIMSQQSPWIATNPHKFLMSTTFLGRDYKESFYKTSETSLATQFIGRLLKRLTSHSVS